MNIRLLVCLVSVLVSANSGASAAGTPVKKAQQKPKAQQTGKPAGGAWNSGLSDMMDQLENQVGPGKSNMPPIPDGPDTSETDSTSEPGQASGLDLAAPGELPAVPPSTGPKPAIQTSDTADSGAAELPPEPASDAEIQAATANSYFEKLQSAGLIRWEKDRMPIRIYIEPASKVKMFRPEFVEILTQAFKDWAQAAPQLKIQFVTTPNECEIKCTWTDNLSDLVSPKEGGHTELYPEPLGRGFRHADLKIYTVPPPSLKEFSTSYIRRVALHEVGHAFGFTNHSDDPVDMMYFSIDPVKNKESELTARDQNTIKVLYAKTSLGPQNFKLGTTDSPSKDPHMRSMQLSNEGAMALNEQRLDVAREKLTEAIKLDPNNKIACKNLSELYSNVAGLAAMTGNLPMATANFKLAIPLLERAGDRTRLIQVLTTYEKVLRMSNNPAELKAIQTKMKALGARF